MAFFMTRDEYVISKTLMTMVIIIIMTGDNRTNIKGCKASINNYNTNVNIQKT